MRNIALYSVSNILEQLEFKLEKIIGVQKPKGKVRKILTLVRLRLHEMIFYENHKMIVYKLKNFVKMH